MPTPNPTNGLMYDPAKIAEVQRALEGLIGSATRGDMWNATASGAPVSNPVTSRAKVPGFDLQQIPGGGSGKAPVFANGVNAEVGTAVKNLGRANIDALLQQVDMGNLRGFSPPPAVPAPPSPVVGILQNLLRAAGPALVIDLITSSGNLNAGEDQMIARRKADDLRSSGGPR